MYSSSGTEGMNRTDRCSGKANDVPVKDVELFVRCLGEQKRFALTFKRT